MNGRSSTPLPGPGDLAPSANVAAGLVVAVVIVSVLYLGREVFVPLALAVLLSFVLAPLVRLLRRAHIPRGISVVTVVLVAFLAILGVGSVIVGQVTELAGDLPRYEFTMREKIAALKGGGDGTSPLERAADVLQNLNKELDKPAEEAPAADGASPPSAAQERPIPVEVREPELGALQTIRNLITPLVHPLATTGLIVIFVLFILLQREDLRNRMVRLAGASDLQRTTAAIDDAGRRLSRLFLTLLALNTSFGIVVGVGLWLIGVPSPIVWGVLAAILRFVPYIGAVIAAVFPLALAAAVDPGWTMVWQTALLFVLVEPLIGHVIEPVVAGHSAGLSPVAVVISATFWTWLWGPIGLILATPLTICLVVLGRHVEKLEFLDVMFGDRPALTPPELFYQRMLAGDASEAADVAEEVLKERSLSAYYDEVALEGLALARVDAAKGTLDDVRLERIRDTVAELVEDLSDHEDDDPRGGDETDDPEAEAAVEETDEIPSITDLPTVPPEDRAPEWRGETPVLAVAARAPLDGAANQMLAQLLAKHGLGARIETAEALSTRNIFRLDTAGVALIALSYLDASSPAHMRYTIRRLRRKAPTASILVGCWKLEGGAEAAEALRQAVKADHVATTLREAVKMCWDAAIDRDPASGAAAQEEPISATRTGAA